MDYGQALRDAVEESGLSQYHLSKLTGITLSSLSKFFASGEINLLTFQKLANLMGFEFRQIPDPVRVAMYRQVEGLRLFVSVELVDVR